MAEDMRVEGGGVTRKGDFTEEFAAAEKDAAILSEGGDVDAAVELLLKLEKQTRLALANDWTVKVALLILKVSREKGSWDTFNTSITLISKRRQQHRKVVGAVVEEALTQLESAETEEKRLQLIATLRDVAEGKIFLEVQRARLTRMVADAKEKEGKIAEAAAILQEVSVETFGTMDEKEKTDFILEQIRLCIESRDHVRAEIVSKKINRGEIAKKGLEAQKLKYYNLLIRVHARNDDTLELCRDFLAIFDTETVQADSTQWKEALQYCALFIVLTPYGKEQWALLQLLTTVHKEKLEQLPAFEALLKLFVTQELTPWPLPMEQDVLAKHPLFVSDRWVDNRKAWTKRLHTRVVQHNIKVISNYYTRIRISRLAFFTGITVAEAEEAISTMVCVEEDDASEPLYAKMDRPAGVVTFIKPRNANQALSAWGENITTLLDLVGKTKHLIDKEMMSHGVK